MSDAETTHVTADEAGQGHGHDTDHADGHAPSEPLGPINVTVWGYAIAGSLLGVLTLLALYVARGT